MRTNPLPHYNNTEPPQVKTPAPLSDIELFLAASTFFCQQYCARISPEQCQANRTKELFLCGKCTQERPKPVAKAKPKKRRKGDNPASPWRDGSMILPKEMRVKDVMPILEVTDGTVLPGMSLGKAGARVERSAQRPQGPAAGKRRGGDTSSADPVVMRIFQMVTKRLEEKR